MSYFFGGRVKVDNFKVDNFKADNFKVDKQFWQSF